MPSKIFRDPLYNYIGIDRTRDKWLLELLACPEVQRLRRIHQLGVSYLTYPGADHNRLAHSLGVLHLMQLALTHLKSVCDDEQVNRARAPLLAAALVHDVGHGPFSHLFEPCLGIDHEEWSIRVILSEGTEVNKVLRRVDPTLPQTVAALINTQNHDHPAWVKYLLSSQLDVDRLDYLRRDSFFTGAGYGHFDWFRILNSFEFHEDDGNRELVWAEKSMLAIEEYIFARYYMYQNVYLHKTTRGFEKLIEAMWKRARTLWNDDRDVGLVATIKGFWAAQQPSIEQYLALEEFTVLQQIQQWTTSADKPLNDLARRFLSRNRLAMVDPPPPKDELAPSYAEWEAALLELVKGAGYEPPEMYCLKDEVKAKYNQPYFPEKEEDEQSVKNAIRIKVAGEAKPVEVSRLLARLRPSKDEAAGRLKPLTEEPLARVRYYLPKELQAQALQRKANWK
jgi:HD superfamily phosphohydrolase